jgi:hypothetical protein
MLEYLEQQKKLTINQWKIFAAVTIGDMLDFFDFLLIAFVLAFIVKDWNLTYGQSAAILLSSGISAPLGSLFYGWLADKIGRRKVMIITILNFSIATGLMALTPEQGFARKRHRCTKMPDVARKCQILGNYPHSPDEAAILMNSFNCGLLIFRRSSHPRSS